MKTTTVKKIKPVAKVQQDINDLRSDIRAAYRRIAQLEECKARETCEGCTLRCKT